MPLTIRSRAEAYSTELPRLSPNSFIQDILTSPDAVNEKITAGFFKVVPGDPLVFTYTYDEFKLVLEVENGEFVLTDETGAVFKPKAGDLLFIPKGTTLTFAVEGGVDAYAHNFYVAQKTPKPK